MKGALLVAVLFVSSVLALSEQEYQDAFIAWTRAHNKGYSSEEFGTRYNVFKSNLDYVNEWNAKGSSAILETNVFADLTNEEYRSLYLGTRIDGSARLAAAAATRESFQASALPDSVDWRTKNIVTPIKNQGQCGSCWSFSTTGSVEGAHALATSNLVSLSEQNLMDCSTAQGNQGCNGGMMDYAFQYIIQNGGIDTEASYPYTMATEKCKYKAENSGATISKYTDVTSGSESALQTASAQQPISVAIDASQKSFQLYKTGVYTDSKCSSIQLDHGVLVVGYGTSNGTDYWLVKNSWGTVWGQQGYVWMSRNKSNQCGIATSASYPTV